MVFLITRFVLKVVSLFGAIANTVGFLTFFFWESLRSHRWQLIIGGVLLIAVSEAIGYFMAKRLQRSIAQQ